VKVFLAESSLDALVPSGRRPESGWIGRALGDRQVVLCQLSVREFLMAVQEFIVAVGMWHVLNISVGSKSVYHGSESETSYDNVAKAFSFGIQSKSVSKQGQNEASTEFEGISHQFRLNYVISFKRKHPVTGEAITIGVLGLPVELMRAKDESRLDYLYRVNRLIEDESAVKDKNMEVKEDFGVYLKVVTDAATTIFRSNRVAAEVSVDVGALLL
jgi:hypothetical protein